MHHEIQLSQLESVRALLWAMTRLLEREDAAARASLFELRTLASTGVQMADALLDGQPSTSQSASHCVV